MLYTYFNEVRSRICLFLIASFFTLLAGYIFKEVLLCVVVNSYTTATGFSYFIFTDVVEVFNVYVRLILFLSKQVLFFYFGYHLFVFMAPGLTKSEYRFFLTLFSTSAILFLLSVTVFYTLLLPFSWKFFLSFKTFSTFKSLTLHFEAKLMDYITFFFNLYLSSVVYFQFFLLPVFFFTHFGKELNVYKSFRKFLYYACIIFSTVVTPPDVTSQVFLSLVLIIGCEILVYGSFLQKVLNSKA